MLTLLQNEKPNLTNNYNPYLSCLQLMFQVCFHRIFRNSLDVPLSNVVILVWLIARELTDIFGSISSPIILCYIQYLLGSNLKKTNAFYGFIHISHKNPSYYTYQPPPPPPLHPSHPSPAYNDAREEQFQ